MAVAWAVEWVVEWEVAWVEGMGGMGSMGRSSGTMPSTMGMMMLARMIMYFAGDPESWDKRSLMIGMMGGMGGGMGGMGGGMMGGMGGGMGGMGGGMRSVPATGLPSSLLNPGQTRHLPTRLVVLTPPGPEEGVKLPEKGEPLQLGDIADINDNPQVQKALRRLAADAASKSISRLVMWHLTAGLDWDTLAAVVAGLGQPLRADAGQGFRGASRHVARRRDGARAVRGGRDGRGERGVCGRSQNGPAAEDGAGLDGRGRDTGTTRRTGGRPAGADVGERGAGAG